METWRRLALDTLRKIDLESFGSVVICDRTELDDRFDYRHPDALGLGSPYLGSILPGGAAGAAGIVVFGGRVRTRYPSIDPGGFDCVMYGICLHEAAHSVDKGRCLVDVHPVMVEAIESYHRGEWELPPPDKTPVSLAGLPPWHGHGPNFVRAALHIYARAFAEGFPAILHNMHIAGDAYGMVPPEKYLRTLGDEPERLRHVPLFDLPGIPFPKRFRDLWEADTLEEFPMPEHTAEITPERHRCDCPTCPPGNRGGAYSRSNGMTFLRCRRCRWTWTMDAKRYDAAVAATPVPAALIPQIEV